MARAYQGITVQERMPEDIQIAFTRKQVPVRISTQERNQLGLAPLVVAVDITHAAFTLLPSAHGEGCRCGAALTQSSKHHAATTAPSFRNITHGY
jgi:hypothetical protein